MCREQFAEGRFRCELPQRRRHGHRPSLILFRCTASLLDDDDRSCFWASSADLYHVKQKNCTVLFYCNGFVRTSSINLHRLQAWRYGVRMSARKISAVPCELLHTSLWSCRSTASTVSQSSSACRPTLPTEHLRPTGLFCRRPVCLELTKLTTGRVQGSGH